MTVSVGRTWWPVSQRKFLGRPWRGCLESPCKSLAIKTVVLFMAAKEYRKELYQHCLLSSLMIKLFNVGPRSVLQDLELILIENLILASYLHIYSYHLSPYLQHGYSFSLKPALLNIPWKTQETSQWRGGSVLWTRKVTQSKKYWFPSEAWPSQTRLQSSKKQPPNLRKIICRSSLLSKHRGEGWKKCVKGSSTSYSCWIYWKIENRIIANNLIVFVWKEFDDKMKVFENKITHLENKRMQDKSAKILPVRLLTLVILLKKI